MATGREMLELAEDHVGEDYVNRQVPKDDPGWRGPWDCAEFMSWLVYQVSGRLYGCLDDADDPATAEAYTGSWKHDSKPGSIGERIPWEQAAATVGAILLRYPPQPGTMGHIAVSDGRGGTVEARGRVYGVCRASADGRDWDTGVLIPWIDYEAPNEDVVVSGPALLYAMGREGMIAAVTARIQRALTDAGADPGPVDGVFGHKTTAAVAAFQGLKGLVADGKVGVQTALALGISLNP
jgi:N-acetylmuramoyl-L-alanine amidase